MFQAPCAKRQEVKIVLYSLWYHHNIEMHGQQHIQICDAKQAKQVYQYKNTKIKLYKSNAAIWYNKTCRIKQLMPAYVNIRV